MTTWIVLAYAILVFIGGLIGHWKAGSTASLIMGSVSGLILLISSYLLWKGHPWGRPLALLLSGLLLAFFSYRFYLTGQVAPVGIMALLILIVVGFTVK